MAQAQGNPQGSGRWRYAIAGLLVTLASSSYAGTDSTAFPVNITLSNPAYPVVSGTSSSSASDNKAFCVNHTLSAKNNATVTVTCSTNLFVSIEPVTGKLFPGSNGGAYRYLFPLGAVNGKADDLTWLAGRGTVTSFKISTLKKNAWDIMEIQINY